MIKVSKLAPPEKDVVHVWHLSLENSALDLPELLSSSELARFAEYSSSAAQSDYLRTRVALRTILSRYLNQSADKFDFVAGENGKPELTEEHAQLQFNLSHSGKHLLLSVSSSCELGVDVEHFKPGRNYAALAKRFYTRDECRMIDVSEDDLLFYRMWVLKEAAVKARGMKLFAGLDRFECYFDASGELSLRDKCNSSNCDGVWTIRQWLVGEDYTAAVVAMGSGMSLVDKK